MAACLVMSKPNWYGTHDVVHHLLNQFRPLPDFRISTCTFVFTNATPAYIYTYSVRNNYVFVGRTPPIGIPKPE